MSAELTATLWKQTMGISVRNVTLTYQKEMRMNQIDFYSISQTDATIMLGSTYNCPTCKDWFHMPFKFCKCKKR